MNQWMSTLAITLMNIVIVVLLLVIRSYQKQLSKMRLEKIKSDQLAIKNDISKSVKADDLKSLQDKYDILMKILNNIEEGKLNENINNQEKTS